MATTQERMIELLPYYLKGGKNTKIYYKAIANIFDELMDIFLDIIDSRDIDKSTLYGLNILGDIVGQIRKIDNDELFRNRVKTKVMQNNSRGYIEDINQLATVFMGNKFIGTKEGWHDNMANNEPALLEVNLDAEAFAKTLIDKSTRSLETGTVAISDRTSLGGNFQATTNIKKIKQYEKIYLPELEQAAAIGVKLQYHMKHDPDITKINKSSNLKVKTAPKVIKINEGKVIYKAYSILQCGMRSTSAQLGVLL
ncbi:hypothetical protein FDF74_12650 [Clostridium niameyense]|uniref:Uncharacterized protein n=1 Tax=Clostridium niameyense TaxID=1622073 RepID=A0A6M0RDW1_9CLOT|nr:hypothetical protein [Clostridium niameyense]NEZ48020.1 hypothetical protein [Clostridium niameyense]